MSCFRFFFFSLVVLSDGQKMAPHVNKWSPLDGAHE